MSCPYNRVCANQVDGAAAVGECVYCERDRLKAEVAELEDANDFLKDECFDFREKAKLWDKAKELSSKLVGTVIGDFIKHVEQTMTEVKTTKEGEKG